VEFEQLKQHWNAFGQLDPLWAILTAPGKRGGGWQLDEFLATGRHEVDVVLNRLEDLGVSVHRGRALDFGCGVGRLTQALAERFETCDGVDLAASMIEQAQTHNRDPGRVHFHLNHRTDLRLFEDDSFDFVLSLIVLQHMEPLYISAYLREFIRVLRPGGIAFFNVPVSFRLGDELAPEVKRAALTLLNPPTTLEPRQSYPLRVLVANRSQARWPLSASVVAGNHWRALDGSMLIVDDARTVLGRELSPEQEHEIVLDITAPAAPGSYAVEVDLLQEHFGWFADAGSSSVRALLTVSGEAGSEMSSVDAGSLEPRMEMHTMAEAEVVGELEQAGGVVFDVRVEDRCGPTIASLDYVVAKSLSSSRLAPGPSEDTRNGARRLMEAGIAEGMEAERKDLIEREIAEIGRLQVARSAASADVPAVIETLSTRRDPIRFSLSSQRGPLGRPSVFLRRVLRRLLLEVFHRQGEFNTASAQLHEELLGELEVNHQVIDVLRHTLSRAETRIEALERAQREARIANAELSRGLARTELRSAMLSRARQDASETADLDYVSLTERFRGTREEILNRQRRYVHHFIGAGDVVDIGCGRGEFLELMDQHAVSAIGVDLEEGMVEQCNARGFEAIRQDGLSYLGSRAENSLGGVFAAQVIEHLEAPDLVRLVRLALSRLRPGGVLVLETINPASLLSLSTFYADLTHRKPVHPEALRWLAESVGFVADIEYTSPVAPDHRLAPLAGTAIPVADLAEFNRGIAFADHLLFADQEYALVARKPATD
jgi:2-polyprenyl-3-methyl-5-hydroxy-6-metoxy-1,4-benzoquinol methylase